VHSLSPEEIPSVMKGTKAAGRKMGIKYRES
jgi:hypothetical protein